MHQAISEWSHHTKESKCAALSRLSFRVYKSSNTRTTIINSDLNVITDTVGQLCLALLIIFLHNPEW